MLFYIVDILLYNINDGISTLTINVYIGNQSVVENPKRIQRVYLLLLIGLRSTNISQVIQKDGFYIYLSRCVILYLKESVPPILPHKLPLKALVQ